MPKLIACEFAKLRRRPLFFTSSLLSALVPIAFALFLDDAQTSEEAVLNMMSSLIQLSAPIFLMPVVAVLAANLLFEEIDNDTLKNLRTIPIDKGKLALAKLYLLVFFSVSFMAVGGFINLVILWIQGWEPVGFWPLFWVGLGEGILIWAGALPCVLLVTVLNKSYIISVILTIFYTVINYLFAFNETLTTQPFGFNPGTLLPGPLVSRWNFQFFIPSEPSALLSALLSRISPYFLGNIQAFGIAFAEAVLFLTWIAFVYKRQEE